LNALIGRVDVTHLTKDEMASAIQIIKARSFGYLMAKTSDTLQSKTATRTDYSNALQRVIADCVDKNQFDI
jgi:hypothetical protein